MAPNRTRRSNQTLEITSKALPRCGEEFTPVDILYPFKELVTWHFVAFVDWEENSIKSEKNPLKTLQRMLLEMPGKRIKQANKSLENIITA